MPHSKRSRAGLGQEPFWYKSGVIYEVHVRAFFDANGDGAGDFRGLTEKLDYIKDLGGTAIWLLLFCPSPLKDDGCDIADYGDDATKKRCGSACSPRRRILQNPGTCVATFARSSSPISRNILRKACRISARKSAARTSLHC